MTAPRELPRCPVCGRKPYRSLGRLRPDERHSTGEVFTVDCFGAGMKNTHNLNVYGRTQAEADARWRHLASRPGGEGGRDRG